MIEIKKTPKGYVIIKDGKTIKIKDLKDIAEIIK